MADTDLDECITSYKYLFQPDFLRGKVAFVTGGGSGIGFTITEIFLRHGCKVVIASRNEAKLKEAADKLERGTGQKCLYFKMDVRKPEEIQLAVEKTLAEYGKIDILVNNAAGNFLAPITGLSYNAFRAVMEIDAFGTFFTSKIVYEKSMKQRGGVIVNITATLHYKGEIMQAHAGAAKAAIDALTRHMANEWAPENVRVVGVAPGPIDDTVGMRKLAGDMKPFLTGMIPLRRYGTKAEIAHAVLYLAGETGSYVTGHVLVVDGGSWLASPNLPAHKMQRFMAVQSKM